MNENIKELVSAMLTKDASKTETAFQAAMAEKISSKLDDMRSSIAQSMFKSPAAEPVVEEELTLEAVDTLTEEQLDEVLTKATPSSEFVSDFVKSEDPRFEGKSKKERIRMALGAYYAKHPEKSNK